MDVTWYTEVVSAAHYDRNIVLNRPSTDIKPENIVFRREWPDISVVLSDFGLSKLLDERTPYLNDSCGTVGVCILSRILKILTNNWSSF